MPFLRNPFVDRIKLQLACTIVLLFIMGLYFSVKRVKTLSHRVFRNVLFVSLFNLVFDMLSVYTVNNLGVVSPWLNRACHLMFFLTMMGVLYYCFCYSSALLSEDRPEIHSHITYHLFAIPMLAAIFCGVKLPIYYMVTPRGNYSTGPAVFSIFGLAVFYFLAAFFLILWKWKNVETKKRKIVTLAYIIQFFFIVLEIAFPTLLASSCGVMLINLAFFMTVESPDVLLIERLKHEKNRADEANAAKSQFLSNMSHEIRTPMNAIVGLTDVLLRGEWPEKEEKYLQNIRSSGDALLSLINDLLDFSKIEAGKFIISPENYNFDELVENLKPIFDTRLGEKPIKLVYNIDGGIPKTLCGDDMRIRQIIINIVNNAIKFTETGSITLAAKILEKNGDTAKLQVSITDTGQGIKSEDLEKLFEAFAQVDIKKNKGKEGTGLGLAICKQLAGLMGGDVAVQSEYGKGSTFTIELPQKIASHETLAQFRAEGKKAAKKQGETGGVTFPAAQILMAEDNKMNQIVARAQFEPLKLSLEIVENGQEAVAAASKKQYDLIFMDHYMPVMNGVEATRQIRSAENFCSKIPIIALTADVVADQRGKFIEAGMNDMVAKPFTVKDIAAALKKHIPEKMVSSE